MQVYSVYNYDTRAYDYYRGRGPGGSHAASPRPSRLKSSLGASPEQASWTLPVGAVKIGSGELPRGRIAAPASIASALAIGDFTPTPANLGIAAVLAYLAWKVIR